MFQTALGAKITNENDIVNFINSASEQYNIKLQDNIFMMLVNEWKKCNKEHIVLFCNKELEWFIDFISEEDIAVMYGMDNKVPPQYIMNNNK